MTNVKKLVQFDGGAEYPLLDDFFTDKGWSPFAVNLLKQIKAYPNRIYFNADEKLGAVVAFRGAHDSWALNAAAINYVLDAVRDGRIAKGYAILATNNPSTVVSVMAVAEVASLLDGVPVREGNFGPYWWVYEKFATDETSMSDAPF